MTSRARVDLPEPLAPTRAIRGWLRSSVVSASTTLGEGYGVWEIELQMLYDAARDTALGVTDVLRGLSAELGLDQVTDPDDLPF